MDFSINKKQLRHYYYESIKRPRQIGKKHSALRTQDLLPKQQALP